ncbi:MAG: hypothetical protein IT303_11650 [Dehalococcoidia bacterium]|nr:hypothetical protein [Dehalococcoidia bacterium]
MTHLRFASFCRGTQIDDGATLNIQGAFTEQVVSAFPGYDDYTLALSFWNVPGSAADVRLEWDLPDGTIEPPIELKDVEVQRPDGAIALIVKLRRNATGPGLFVLRAFVNGELAAHVPLRIRALADGARSRS